MEASLERAASTDPPLSPGLMQLALDQSASGIMVCEIVQDEHRPNPALRIVLVNRRAGQFLNSSRTELLGRAIDDVFLSATTEELGNQAHLAIETGKSSRFECFLSLRQHSVSAWFDMCLEPAGDNKRVVLSFTDITETRMARQALIGESILFRALSSTVPEMGVIVTDYFKKIITASGLLPDLLAHTNPDELTGELLENIVMPEFREDWRNYLGTALRGEAHFFSDHWAGWRSEVYVGPVYNEQGEVVMILIVFRNVTELYRQQQALIQSNMALEQSNRSLEQFAYVASHDLQEPLRKIKSFGDLLRNNYGNAMGEEGIGLISRMQSASERMSTLIQSLLAYARLSSEQRLSSTVHLEDLFNELISDLSVAIQERQGVIRLRPPLPIIPGDEQQLRQLFQNLLVNALKFVPANRSPIITVSARVLEGANVPGAIDPDAVYAQIDIQDNGIGIDEQNFDKIFGLFSRLHGRKDYEGSGIGLATTKKVVENHKGAITIDSEKNIGTTFHVFLPTRREGEGNKPA